MSAEVQPLDRSLVISQGQHIVTRWIPIHCVQLANTTPMAIGDVDMALRKVISNGEGSWPPPVGYWIDTVFRITDGRHEYIARLMRGQRKIFVAWVEEIQLI